MTGRGARAWAAGRRGGKWRGARSHGGRWGRRTGREERKGGEGKGDVFVSLEGAGERGRRKRSLGASSLERGRETSLSIAGSLHHDHSWTLRVAGLHRCVDGGRGGDARGLRRCGRSTLAWPTTVKASRCGRGTSLDGVGREAGARLGAVARRVRSFCRRKLV